MELPEPKSEWIATTPQTDYPQLKGRSSTDVAVVGGGISGLTTAYFLDRKGYDVTILESDRLVRGVTGHTTAKVTSLHQLKYHYLVPAFGKEKARLYGEANEDAIQRIEEISDRENIDCDFTRAPAYTYVRRRKNRNKIEKEVRAAKKLGLPASFEEEIPLPFDVEAAVKFENQAYFHPRKYLLGLVEAFSENVDIYENTAINDVNGTIVKGGEGRVEADHVVAASHFPFQDRAFYFARQYPSYSYAVAVKMEDPPKAMTLSASGGPFHSYRPSGDLAIVGGQGHKTGQGGNTQKRYGKLAKEARESLDVESVKHIWSTQDYSTMDRIPYVGRITPGSDRQYIITGFGGWGMTNGTASGILISDLIDGEKNEWETLYNPNRMPPRNAVSKFFKENIDVAKVFLSGWAKKRQSDPVSLENGEARILEVGGEKIAAYRDKDGKLHTQSAVCNHMGCIVSWNNAEKTWDCPCHGSRFNYDGSVVHGPADEDLEDEPLD